MQQELTTRLDCEDCLKYYKLPIELVDYIYWCVHQHDIHPSTAVDEMLREYSKKEIQEIATNWR